MFFPLRLHFISAVIYKELLTLFKTPIAYVFLVIFLLLNASLTMHIGNFLAQGQASLAAFFSWHPWLYLCFVPAIGMGIWSEENRLGTIELLASFPITIGELVVGKFLGLWLFLGLTLLLTFPFPLLVIWLGNPDISLIILGYVASFCLSGIFLAITSFASAISRNQIICFIISLMVCLFFVVIGNPLIIEYLQKVCPSWLSSSIETLGIYPHLINMDKGIVHINDVFYFCSFVGIFLYLTSLVVSEKRSG